MNKTDDLLNMSMAPPIWLIHTTVTSRVHLFLVCVLRTWEFFVLADFTHTAHCCLRRHPVLRG